MVVFFEFMQVLDVRLICGLFVFWIVVDRELCMIVYCILKGWLFIVLVGVYSECFFELWCQQVWNVVVLVGLVWFIMVVVVWWLLCVNCRVEMVMCEVVE